MKTQNRDSAFIRTEWVIATVVLAFLLSMLLKIANIWIKSNIVANAATIIAATPVILIVVFLIVYIVMQPYIDRRIIREMEKINKETSQNQQTSAGDVANRAAPEK